MQYNATTTKAGAAVAIRQIRAKFAGKCSSCGGRIEAGEMCEWVPGAIRHIACPAPQQSAAPKSVTVTMGVFKKDGRIYVVKPNKDKTRVYAKEIVPSAERMTESGAVVEFETVYRPGMVFNLTESDRWNLAEANEFLTKFARCIVCGRHLKAAKSVASAIGPVCAKYFAGNNLACNGNHNHGPTAADDAAEAAEAALETMPEPKAEGTCTKCGEGFSNCTSDYHCKHNQKMAALRAAPLTADEEFLMSEIRRMNRQSREWMANNPGSWASQLVEDIAHWRDYGIRSVAEFDMMEAAEAAKERRKAGYDYDYFESREAADDARMSDLVYGDA